MVKRKTQHHIRKSGSIISHHSDGVTIGMPSEYSSFRCFIIVFRSRVQNKSEVYNASWHNNMSTGVTKARKTIAGTRLSTMKQARVPISVPLTPRSRRGHHARLTRPTSH